VTGAVVVDGVVVVDVVEVVRRSGDVAADRSGDEHAAMARASATTTASAGPGRADRVRIGGRSGGRGTGPMYGPAS
jgi:hypothetical protein